MALASPRAGSNMASMQVESVQPTPNPNAFKFVVDQVLCEGTRNYPNRDHASGHDLAQKLFDVPGVHSLFFCDRFVTVTLGVDGDWRQVHEAISAVLQTSEGIAPAEQPGASAPIEAEQLSAGDQELLGQINSILDERVRPALAGDGGGLEVIGLAGKTLHIRYQGACGSCPSAIAGTLTAIQGLLQAEVDSEISVVPG